MYALLQAGLDKAVLLSFVQLRADFKTSRLDKYDVIHPPEV